MPKTVTQMAQELQFEVCGTKKKGEKLMRIEALLTDWLKENLGEDEVASDVYTLGENSLRKQLRTSFGIEEPHD